MSILILPDLPTLTILPSKTLMIFHLSHGPTTRLPESHVFWGKYLSEMKCYLVEYKTEILWGC